MGKIFEIATNVSTPLMVAGFFAGSVFLILRQILKMDLFPTLTRQLSANIIKLIIEKLFTLALIALVLGFTGFVVTILVSKHQSPLTSSEDLFSEDSDLFIDYVSQVWDHSMQSNSKVLVFDITLRNPSPNPINVTNVSLEFDRELAGSANSVATVSGTYVITVSKGGASSLGPNGRFKAYTWYPNPDGKYMIVKCTLSQFLAPKTTDRLRVGVEFNEPAALRGPFRTLVVSLDYNDSKKAWSRSIEIQYSTTPKNG